jgi:hypothetical protein
MSCNTIHCDTVTTMHGVHCNHPWSCKVVQGSTGTRQYRYRSILASLNFTEAGLLSNRRVVVNLRQINTTTFLTASLNFKWIGAKQCCNPTMISSIILSDCSDCLLTCLCSAPPAYPPPCSARAALACTHQTSTRCTCSTVGNRKCGVGVHMPALVL